MVYWSIDEKRIRSRSRGQAWGLYGYTMMYRETKEKRYLEQAEKIARYLLPLLAERPVPAWDFNAPGEVGGFLLKHSTGFYRKNSEVDVPLSYADYYFLEALYRLPICRKD